MRLSRAGTSDQDDAALLGQELASREITDQQLVDRRALEGEVVDVLGQGQLGEQGTETILTLMRPEGLMPEPFNVKVPVANTGIGAPNDNGQNQTGNGA